MKAILARVDRDIAQNQKLRAESETFNAEQRKLYREELKLGAEQLKLAAEGAKLRRDHGLAPWLAIAGLVGGILSTFLTIAKLRTALRPLTVARPVLQFLHGKPYPHQVRRQQQRRDRENPADAQRGRDRAAR
jgi:hypothetical protein